VYQVFDRLLQEELQDRIPLEAKRLVIHSTANPGVGDEAHFKWLNQARRHGWAHYYLDWDSISRLVPEGMVAPAQGPTANRDSISIEICEAPAGQTDEFLEAWERAVWLAADILDRYGWETDVLFSHADISKRYPAETDHTDPIAYFAQFGRSFSDFTADVAAALKQRRELPPAEDWQEQLIDQLITEGLLTERRHPNQPVVWWELAAMLLRVRQPK
jgi:hypothetical protein